MLKDYLTKYPDGSSYFELSIDHDRGKAFVFRVNSYEDLWHLNQFIDARRGKPTTVIIPNLIDAQADRRFEYNQSFGLKLVCEFLAKMDAEFVIFHPHNPEVVEAIMDNVTIMDNSDFIRKVLYKIGVRVEVGGGLNNPNMILMSADAGGFKPLMKTCNELKWEGETYSASKSRQYINGESKLTQIVDRQDFGGKDVVIVDDICIGGGTFKGLAKLLRERNVGNLYLAVSHMTIQNHKDSELFDLFDRVFVSNSKYDNYFFPDKDGGKQPENLTVIKLF